MSFFVSLCIFLFEFARVCVRICVDAFVSVCVCLMMMITLSVCVCLCLSMSICLFTLVSFSFSSFANSRLPSNSLTFSERDVHMTKFSGRKPAAGSSRMQRRSTQTTSLDAELAILPLTRAQTTGGKVEGSAASVPTSKTMALMLSDSRRPPTGVRGRSQHTKHTVPLAIDLGTNDNLLEHGFQSCSYPGETVTLVMSRQESSLRHPESYACWLANVRRLRQPDIKQHHAGHSPASKRTGGQSRVDILKSPLCTYFRKEI